MILYVHTALYRIFSCFSCFYNKHTFRIVVVIIINYSSIYFFLSCILIVLSQVEKYVSRSPVLELIWQSEGNKKQAHNQWRRVNDRAFNYYIIHPLTFPRVHLPLFKTVLLLHSKLHDSPSY